MTRWLIAAVAATFLAVPSAARAETITFGATSTLDNGATTTLALPTFDNSLGTLNSVQLSLVYSSTTLQVGVTNPFPESRPAAVVVLSFMSMNTQGQTFGSIVDIQGGAVTVPPGESVVPIQFGAGSVNRTFTTGLSPYTSAAGSTFQLIVDNRIVFANGDMPLRVAGGTGIPFSQSVTYDYTPGATTPPVEPPPVPLPAAAWGGAALLAGLGTARRLRARRLLRSRDL